jgi:vacuolar protein sorting-associated protein 13A/C
MQAQPKSRTVSLDVRADGQRQILRITNYNPERSLYKLRQRNSLLSATRHETASSHIEAFEAVPEDVSPNYSVRVDLAGVGVSLINKRMVEVIYLVMDSIKFEYTDSIVAQSINLSCNTLQIDNQLHEALYPVILQPTPMSKEAVAVGVPPTVQASVIWLKDRGLSHSSNFWMLIHLCDRTWSTLYKILFSFAASFDN